MGPPVPLLCPLTAPCVLHAPLVPLPASSVLSVPTPVPLLSMLCFSCSPPVCAVPLPIPHVPSCPCCVPSCPCCAPPVHPVTPMSPPVHPVPSFRPLCPSCVPPTPYCIPPLPLPAPLTPLVPLLQPPPDSPCPSCPPPPPLRYFFPRQLLIRHFWTPRQQQEFSEENHSARQAAYPAVLSCLDTAVQSLPQQQLQHRLRELCVEVQRGRHPLVAELCAVQSLFSGPALRLGELRAAHLRALSRVLFLTPLLPAVLVRRRLRSHLLEIRHLDRALARLGLAQLSEEELRAACYLRGLNPAQLSAAQCRAWLEQWLRLSCVLQASEASLLANSMVLLSLNYAGAKK
uniref:LETM1 domain containing 1 n=1 Tax=Phasianus colchicus TaxID=9054 RepID=A0A669QIY6_PHACC